MILNMTHSRLSSPVSWILAASVVLSLKEASEIVVAMLDMVTEVERKFICERQQAGTQEANRAGVYKGLNPSSA